MMQLMNTIRSAITAVIQQLSLTDNAPDLYRGQASLLGDGTGIPEPENAVYRRLSRRKGAAVREYSESLYIPAPQPVELKRAA